MATLGWRSTTLALAERHCPRALDFYEASAPYDRSVFATGTAAHAVLEDIGKEGARRGEMLSTEEGEEVARLTCERLIAEGRDFEGDPEPPLPSAAVWAGRDLAMAYHRDVPLASDARYEIGLAVSRDWLPCPYGPGAWLRARIDRVRTCQPDWWEDDEGGGPILEVTDYKSAWSADESELRTLQRKIQALLSWRAWGEGHDALRLVVVNFRLRRPFDLVVYPNTPEGEAVLARWQRDIESEIAARESQVGPDGRRPASPGPQCGGCPYLGQCGDAQAFLGTVYGSFVREDLARFYALALAQGEALENPLRAATVEAPIAIDGYLVGSVAQEQRALVQDAAERLAAIYLRKTRPRDLEAALANVPGLLAALRLGLAQVESLLTHLYKGSEEERDKRADLLAELVTSKASRRFGVHASPEASS